MNYWIVVRNDFKDFGGTLYRSESAAREVADQLSRKNTGVRYTVLAYVAQYQDGVAAK
jgi:hypothetical protein